jgi:hypothetical protein
VLVWAELSVYAVIILFSLFVALTMWLVRRWHQSNMQVHKEELVRLLEAAEHVHHGSDKP